MQRMFFSIFIFLILISSILIIVPQSNAQSCSGSTKSFSYQTCTASIFQGDCICDFTNHSESSTCGPVFSACYYQYTTSQTCSNDVNNCTCSSGQTHGFELCGIAQPTNPPTATPRPPTSTSAPGQPTSTPYPTSSPTPTPDPGNGGGCIGLGGACLSNQQGCCAGSGCQTTDGLPGYGTCFDDGASGGCSYAACNGNACTDHFYNPDPARGGCYKSDDYRCNITNGCLTPEPTFPVGGCQVSAPYQTSTGKIFDVSMTKDQSGGYLLCTQPIISTSTKCSVKQFDYCFDTTGCDGTVEADAAGTCSMRFDCTNSQNGAQISCSYNTQIVDPTPTTIPATPTPWIQVNVKKTDGTTRNVSQICRVDCNSSTCNIKDVCAQDVNTFTFPKVGIVNERGGQMELSAPNGQPLMVLGVTPSAGGFYYEDCKTKGGACYTWPAGSWTTGGRIATFIVVTPTPTPTPTVIPWKKVADSSFQSHSNITIDFPEDVIPFDGDDNNGQRFIVKKAGIATSPDTNLAASKINANGWYNKSDPTIVLNKTSFLSYAKARKKMTTLTTLSSDLSEITGDGIYFYDPVGGPLTITTNYATQAHDFVLIVNGAVVFDIGTERFNVDTTIATKPARRSIAILANSISFSSGANFMSNANGIFIANSISTGTATDKPLKIKGNIITASLINGRTNGNNQSPSVFVVFDGKQYVDLLPLLSVSKYDWKQLQ